MPIWLRLFTFGLIREHFEKEKQMLEKSNNTLVNNQPSTVPNYTIKARK